ncbi:MAG: hypothetical protein M1831_004676 [Alyxoria varia]|nr:MAG: hypothetical protein M1831_004676 [Alyxoria varia]
MQEHIRRAHPEHYISKLPATEDSFHLMVNKPPSERPQQHPQQPPLPPHNAHSYGHSSALHLKTPSQQENKRLINQNKDYVSDAHSFYNHHHPSSPAAARHSNDHFRRSSVLPTASAAAALAQLSNSRPDTDWDPGRDAFNDPDTDPNFNNYFTSDPQNMFAESHGPMNDPHSRQGNLLPSQFSHQSSSRATSLQPFPKPRPSRPRKSSITESARKPKHERQRSKDKRQAHDRKALSAEPSNMAALGNDKKWADLLDAAASATEEDSRDLTPVGIPRYSNPVNFTNSISQIPHLTTPRRYKMQYYPTPQSNKPSIQILLRI